MKYKKIIPIIVTLSALILSSCDDQIMEWQDRAEDSQITTAELPLELAEKIERYDALNSYTDFILGAGVGVDLYLNNETYSSITNENFDDVTAGYAMKHGPMVNSNGELNFTNVDAFIAKTKEAGLSVFGHTLVWHQNNNASYLNGLLAPTIIPGASGSNSLDLSALKDTSLDGWAGNWNTAISVVEDQGLSGDTQAIQMIADGTSNPWELQLGTPAIPIVNGHSYEVSFYIKSDIPGQGRISFDANLVNQYPWMDWYADGSDWTEAFSTTSEWQQVKITLAAADFQPGATSFMFNFDLGYLSGVTYLIDVDNISVVDLDAEPEALLNLSDLRDGSLANWAGNWNTAISVVEGEGLSSTDQAIQMIADGTSNPWELQLGTPAIPIVSGHSYEVSFYIKSDLPGQGRISFDANLVNQYPWMDWYADGSDWTEAFTTTTEWQQVKITLAAADFQPDATSFMFNFDLGYLSGVTYLIDVETIIVTDLDSSGGGGGSAPIVVEKTDEEKAEIIGEAMENWISQMVGHYKEDVHAWDVVNEPMREGGSLRDGNVDELADDEFYWVKYLGQDYAVTAFNLARQYGNATDILFINDYNLESSLAKCDGLIEYVNYIESQGATVDGIGTQMHISANSDRDNIVEMFKKLAASGKLIKISELDVRLGTNAPTTEQLVEQADMYKFVIDMYKEHIPSAQQYGITIWGISDNEEEHEFWLPDESPNLWDANYNRKHAYKGAADGLAGRDVSEDFTGELED
ncbi:endo-1,4-beta-xylanase [Flaviramulus sp. BrNp1-15]|uniref:endo-1,4-beta-xylanase n=1 Tax=Flaviramulus sp. BrNp1-15 TaxID=2916754 RepID=UPI001EE7A908|nr:endo-1,4-beta-xylanase [Flaviramulus sp. BrNp1-15]ULC58781.1 endo-1,4-beta-xylanase [Flaviramulus sp. BrNp1-15]